MWMLKLLGTLGVLRDLVSRMFEVFKNTAANVRRKSKDEAVDDAISAALGHDDQLRDSRSEERRKTD